MQIVFIMFFSASRRKQEIIQTSRDIPKMRCAAILLLAGKSSRFAAALPKQFQMLGTKKVYEHALEVLETSGLFEEIVLVVPEGISLPGSVSGGETRQLSCHKGILALCKNTDYVLVHDGVRPFLTQDILERNLEAVKTYHAVNTCIPSADTINLVEEGKSSFIFPRQQCMRAQTPQTFAYPLLLEAHEKSRQRDAPCDCSIVLEQGHPIHIVKGCEKNFKITSQIDFALAHFFLAEEPSNRLY